MKHAITLSKFWSIFCFAVKVNKNKKETRILTETQHCAIFYGYALEVQFGIVLGQTKVKTLRISTKIKIKWVKLLITYLGKNKFYCKILMNSEVKLA